MVPCASDLECDDGQYCTGTERCAPGEPGVAANGCLAGTNPCASLTVCNERADRCDEDDCSSPDADGDGDPRVACGGSDCADDDMMRSGRRVEICDAFGVDEDCNPSTLYDSATRDGDSDGDGHAALRCFNLLDGGGETRGVDCDDIDPAIHEGAPERCNGVDDDCDMLGDEDFACRQGEVTAGVNSCGTTGERRCSSSCEWQDADYYATEVLASCNYCDDSGLGLAPELMFANQNSNHALGAPTEPVVFHGTATDGGFFGRIFGTAGAMTFNRALTIGYGDMTIDATVRLFNPVPASWDPSYGWSIVLVPETATSFVGLAEDTGVPDTPGWAGAWTWGNPLDNAALRRLPRRWLSSASVPSMAYDSAIADGSSLAQQARMRVVPDDPATAEDDTRISFSIGGGTAAECRNFPATPSGTCGATISPGSRWWIGVSVGASATSSGSVRTVVQAGSVTVQRTRLCPE